MPVPDAAASDQSNGGGGGGEESSISEEITFRIKSSLVRVWEGPSSRLDALESSSPRVMAIS